MSSAQREQVIRELHKAARRNYKRRRTILHGIDDLWQADLAEYRDYYKQNNGYKYILVVIDCFSKFLWTIALKDKTAACVSNAMNDILKGKRQPSSLQTDKGTEFYNQKFKMVMGKYTINHYSTYTTMKASIAERVIRTIKTLISKEFTRNGNKNWVSILHKITQIYNQRKHRTINMKPSDVHGKKIERLLLSTVYSNIKIAAAGKYKTGDTVRISKQKALFEKGYTRNWSTELFKIDKVQLTNPVTYLLKDYQDQPILGAFYEDELQRAKYGDIYLIEQVIRKKGTKMFVKWLGFDKSHNSWVDKHNIK
jgi:hypothetical protein